MMIANQRALERFLWLAICGVIILGVLAVKGHILWLLPVSLVIAMFTGLAAYLKLKTLWARILGLVLFGLGLFALCITPTLFSVAQ